MVKETQYYDILGVKPSAPPEEIKKTYDAHFRYPQYSFSFLTYFVTMWDYKKVSWTEVMKIDVNLYPGFEQNLSEVENTQIIFRRRGIKKKKQQRTAIPKTKPDEKALCLL